MKTLFKSIILLIAVWTSFLLVNCNQDEEADQLQEISQSRFNVSILKSAQLKNKPQLLEELSKLQGVTRQISGREVYNSQYDFTINTENIAQIIDNETNLATYTFAILGRDLDEAMQNLLIQEQNDGSYLSSIIEYNFTKRDFRTNPESLSKEFKYFPIEIDVNGIIENSSATSRCIPPHYQCVEVWETQTTSGVYGNCDQEHANGETCEPDDDTVSVLVTYECWWEQGSGCGGEDNEELDSSGSGSGSGYGGAPSTITAPIVTTPTMPVYEYVIACLGISAEDGASYLTDEQRAWLQTREGSSHANAINDFLIAKGCDSSNQQFAQETIQALMEGGEVDFDKEVIFNISDDCHRKIVENTFNNTSELTQSIKAVFESQNTEYFYLIDTSDTMPSGYAGATNPVPSCASNCLITTTLNSNIFTNSTDLFVASTVIHEAPMLYLYFYGIQV